MIEITCRFGPAPGETFAPDLVLDTAAVPVLVHGQEVGHVATVTGEPGQRQVVLTLDPSQFTFAPAWVQTSHGWRLVEVSLMPK